MLVDSHIKRNKCEKFNTQNTLLYPHSCYIYILQVFEKYKVVCVGVFFAIMLNCLYLSSLSMSGVNDFRLKIMLLRNLKMKLYDHDSYFTDVIFMHFVFQNGCLLSGSSECLAVYLWCSQQFYTSSIFQCAQIQRDQQPFTCQVQQVRSPFANGLYTPTPDAHSSRHLVPSHQGLTYMFFFLRPILFPKLP